MSLLVAVSVALSTFGVGAGAGGAQQSQATGPAAFAEVSATVGLRGRPHSPSLVAGQSPVVGALTGHRLTGTATWYRWRIGQAAAGPRLRAALGTHWRGRIVTVSRGTRHVRVRLSDWCLCSWSRVIDLDHRSFDDLMPLWRGVTTVSVSW